MTQDTTKTPVEFRAKAQWLNYLRGAISLQKSRNAFKAAFILQCDEPNNSNTEQIKVLKWHVKTNYYINYIIHLIRPAWCMVLLLLFFLLHTAESWVNGFNWHESEYVWSLWRIRICFLCVKAQGWHDWYQPLRPQAIKSCIGNTMFYHTVRDLCPQRPTAMQYNTHKAKLNYFKYSLSTKKKSENYFRPCKSSIKPFICRPLQTAH